MEILRKTWNKRQSVAATIIWIALVLAAASQVILAINDIIRLEVRNEKNI